MNKRYLFLFSFFLLMFPVSINASNEGAIETKGELAEKEVNYIEIITKDFQESYDIKLNNYNFVHHSSLKNRNNSQTNSLKSIIKNISKEQKYIDLPPLIYKNEESAYILQKTLDGKNVLYSLNLNKDDEWELDSKKVEQGIQPEELGLFEN